MSQMDVLRSDNRVTTSNSSKRSTPVLNPPLLAQVECLNLDYLQLLRAEQAAPGCATQLQHMSSSQREMLMSLDARSLRLMAATPYSLYSLGFEDEGFWSSVCAHVADASEKSTVIERYTCASDAPAQRAFCELALIHAWHVAATNLLATRMLYAMPYAVAQRFVTMPLWQVKWIASKHATMLQPRWPTNPAFWSDLMRLAAADDLRRLNAARLHGLQLIASELEVACPLSRRDPTKFPVLASPRLRARKSRVR